MESGYQVIECCPNCGREINMQVDVGTTVIPYCPWCGERDVLLCSECMDCIGNCNPGAPGAYCHNRRNLDNEHISDKLTRELCENITNGLISFSSAKENGRLMSGINCSFFVHNWLPDIIKQTIKNFSM